jgi:hypothetical protein
MKPVTVKEFKIDNNIAYLIQQSTGDTTQEILGYFYGIATFVGEDIAKSSRASFLNKDIILYYKETPIPYRLQIHGGNPREKVDMRIDISFPKLTTVQNVTELMDKVVEAGLGLIEEEEMPKFTKPNLKTPRCLKSVRIAQDEQRK